MKLYWHPFSVFPRRVQIALREKQLLYEEAIVDVLAGAQRDPAFRRLNPFGQIPVLDDGGMVISESVAILEYLEDRYPLPALMGHDPSTRARTRQLMLWSNDYLAPAWKACMGPRFRPDVKPDDPSVLQGREALGAHLDVLEDTLEATREAAAGRDRGWLVHDYSLADICYAPFVTTLGILGLDDLLATRPTVREWIDRLAARPAVRDTAPASLKS